MNISKIVDMFDNGEAPELQENPPKPGLFVNRMNLENVTQTIKSPVIVEQEKSIITSIAKMNGGTCTLLDIKTAQEFVSARPLQADAESRFEKVRSAILSGEVTTLQQIKDKFIE